MAKRWYIVHTYSNFEKKVMEDIKKQVVQKKLDELFEQVIVPTEEVVEIRRGRRVQDRTPLLPRLCAGEGRSDGRSVPSDQEHPKVTGFLGSGLKPVPISGCRSISHPQSGG